MAVTIYEAKTCETVKKARNCLDGHGAAHCFVDYRAEGSIQSCSTAGASGRREVSATFKISASRVKHSIYEQSNASKGVGCGGVASAEISFCIMPPQPIPT